MISLRLSEQLVKELEQMANAKGFSKSDLIRQAIIFYLYYFNPETRLRFLSPKPIIKELKQSFQAILKLPKDAKVRVVKHANKILVLGFSGSKHEIIASQLRFPRPVSDYITKHKNSQLVIIAKKCKSFKIRVE